MVFRAEDGIWNAYICNARYSNTSTANIFIYIYIYITLLIYYILHTRGGTIAVSTLVATMCYMKHLFHIAQNTAQPL